ncbi:MAG TPA: DUF2079 domain-containing protein [Ktedonobacteraceae bacterium]|nr:DUF2079 domain-containing protein [Ktedonobacteraceae bacterium]
MKKIVKLLSLTWQRLYTRWKRGLYPAPEPLAKTRDFWIALGLVTLAVLAYIIYFSIFLTTKQDAFLTNGEDLGIMDQAIWTLLHGSMLHQTICNSLTDTNCYGLNGISRFAIHFEPILFPISLLYLFWPDPKTLMIFQVLVVASGAFPAFWLARLRLRNAWAGVPFALLYLLYPAQQYAVNFDFHAETLTIALLLFALYFLYTRKTFWFLVFAVLCLACKEEIAGVIFLLGLWTLLFQARPRLGLGLAALALGWTAMGLLVVHYCSPIGHSLLASRYAYLGNNPVRVALNILTHPVQVIQQHVLESAHMHYLRELLAPAGYLPLLAPWVLLLASPTIALNLLSSTPNMYSGDFQYNAEIIPILIFSCIEATVLLLWSVRWLMVHLSQRIEKEERVASEKQQAVPFRPAQTYWPSLSRLVQVSVIALVLCYMLVRVFNSTVQYNVYSVMPYAHGFVKPQMTQHDKLASRFLKEIPPDASVSAQTTLVPHLSERQYIYLFPYGVGHADYIFLDASNYTYPFKDYDDYATTVKGILQQGNYGIKDMDDGYLLLKQGYPQSDIAPAIKMIDDDADDQP